MLATNICSHHSCNQISQPCSAVQQDTGSGGSRARTQFLLSYKTRSDSHSAAWGEHLQIHGDIEPSPVVLDEQASMEKTTQTFRELSLSLHNPKKLPQANFFNSLTGTPTEQAILPSQSTSHTGAHLMQPSIEAYEAEDRCFRVSVARRLMMPHPAAPNAADVVQSSPTNSAALVICNKPVDPQQHHFYGCRYGGGIDRRHAAVTRCLADVTHSHRGTKVFIEQEVPALTRVSQR